MMHPIIILLWDASDQPEPSLLLFGNKLVGRNMPRMHFTALQKQQVLSREEQTIKVMSWGGITIDIKLD